MKLLEKSYRAVDDGFMYCANRAVEAYNWTTGGTKDELANYFVGGFIVLGSVGSFLIHPVYGALIIPMCSISSHLAIEKNTKMAKSERHAANRGKLNLEAESYKLIHRYIGPSSILIGTYMQVVSPTANEESFPNGKIGGLILGASLDLYGVSSYIMRADDLPPKDNVVKRTRNRLLELYDEYRPAPIPVRTDR